MYWKQEHTFNETSVLILAGSVEMKQLMSFICKPANEFYLQTLTQYVSLLKNAF